MSSKKKSKPEIIFIVIGLVLFFIGMLGIIIDAVTLKNTVIAWIMVAIIMFGCTMTMVGLIYFVIKNKEKIKKYLNEIK